MLFTALTIFVIFKFNVFAPSSSTVAYIGGNTTKKIGCYDPAYIKHVAIAKGSKEDKYDTEIYKTVQNDFRYQIQTLKNQTDDNKEDHNRKIPINYYSGDNPVYAAHRGNLTYEVRGESLSKLSSHCPLEFYLFNNKGDYDTFINEEFSLPVHATKTSGCLPVNSTARNFTIQFSLDEPGFYFVGVSLIEHVHINTTISGSIVEFNTSELSEEPCSLNYYDECTIAITKSKLPSVTSQDPLVCVLVKSFGYEYRNINISVEFVEWNSVSVGFGSFSLLTLNVLVFVVIIFVFIFLKRRRKIAHHNNGYMQIPDYNDSEINVHEEIVRPSANRSRTEISYDTSVQESSKTKPEQGNLSLEIAVQSNTDREHLMELIDDYMDYEVENVTEARNSCISVNAPSPDLKLLEAQDRLLVESTIKKDSDNSYEHCSSWSDGCKFSIA